MKVLDLQCEHLHVFEGWFASEEEFLSQCARSLMECPLCGSSKISKRLSAPRLHLGTQSRQNIDSADQQTVLVDDQLKSHLTRRLVAARHA